MSPAKRKQNEELESQLLGLLKGTIGGMDRKIDRNTKRIDTLERDVDELEEEVFKKPVPITNLPPPWKDPKNFKIILWIILGIIAIILAFKGIDISKVFT